MLRAVYFSAPWCGPCKTYGPLIEDFCKAKGIDFIKVNVDEAPELSAEYEVRSIPTTIFYRDDKFLTRVVGSVSERKLQEVISK